MVFGIEVISISLSFQPGQQAPFSRSHPAFGPPANWVRALFIPADAVSLLRALERERGILLVGEHPFVERACMSVALRVLAGVHERGIGQTVGGDVIAPPTEIVIGAPSIGGGNDC